MEIQNLPWVMTAPVLKSKNHQTEGQHFYQQDLRLPMPGAFFLATKLLALADLGPTGKSVSLPSDDSSTSKLGQSSPPKAGFNTMGNFDTPFTVFLFDLIAPK